MFKKLFMINIIIAIIGITLVILKQENKIINVILLLIGVINILIIKVKLSNNKEK